MRGMGLGTAGMLTAAVGASLAIAVLFTPDDDEAIRATETAMGMVVPVGDSPVEEHQQLADRQIVSVLDTTFTALMELSGLAVSKAQDTTVRSVAAAMMTRDGQLRSEIRVLVERPRNAGTVATQLLRGHHEALEGLRMRSGQRFDRLYLDRSLQLNRALLEHVRQALGTPVSVPVRAYLDRIAAELEIDLERMREVRSALAGTVVAASY